jgi:hypothetical protein
MTFASGGLPDASVAGPRAVRGGRRSLPGRVRDALAALPHACALLGLLCVAALGGCSEPPPQYAHPWTEFERVAGQPEPVPKAWLADPEARFTHDIRLPDAIPGPVPFDFRKARLKALWPGTPEVGVQYFRHLCRTEAGEWILKRVEGVRGLYFARPPSPRRDTEDDYKDPYAFEAPHLERGFKLRDETAKSRGAVFVYAPVVAYEYVEEPRRAVSWQQGIDQPTVRLFGLRHEPDTSRPCPPHGCPMREVAPMQVVGIARPESRYMLTWRGVKRAQDRENGIAGGEMIVLDRQTGEVLAVRRNFVLSGRYRGRDDATMWMTAGWCTDAPHEPQSALEFTRFALKVLRTVERSTEERWNDE